MSKINVNTITNLDETGGPVIVGITTVSGNFNVTGVSTISGLTYPTAGPLSNRNLIINGDMRIDQRNAGFGTAVGTATAGTYGLDRFWGYTGTGSVWTTSRVSTGNRDFPFANRLQRANGSSSTSPIYWRQIIESANCSYLAGQTVTLSFYVTAGADYSGSALQVNIYTGTASDEGATALNTAAWTSLATPLNSFITPTTTRTRYTFTATLGATVQEVAMGITFTPSGTAGTNDFIDITGVQLEAGSVATLFEHRSHGDELARCERYYQQSWTGGASDATSYDGDLIACPVSNSTGTLFGTTFLRQTMRATPTLTEAGSGTLSSGWAIVTGSGTPVAKTSILAAKADRRTIKLSVPVTGVSGGQAYTLIGNWTASAEL